MTNLCHDCLLLIPFGWSEQPCDKCGSPSMIRPPAHDCATLDAMGWEEAECDECRTQVALAA